MIYYDKLLHNKKSSKFVMTYIINFITLL